jgi:hypothetical protein
MNRRLRMVLLAGGCVVVLALAGCFAPPTAQPPEDSKVSTIVPLPYDLTWEAVKAVIRQNGYHIQAEDPNNGILEVAGKDFSLQDADCGKISSIAGSYAATPEKDASAVYNFGVMPHGVEASKVIIDATFASPLRVPLRRVQNLECVSRGVQEERLLREILAQARHTRPPEYRHPQGAAAAQSKPKEPALTGRPTLLRPDVIHPEQGGPHLAP